MTQAERIRSKIGAVRAMSEAIPPLLARMDKLAGRLNSLENLDVDDHHSSEWKKVRAELNEVADILREEVSGVRKELIKMAVFFDRDLIDRFM